MLQVHRTRDVDPWRVFVVLRPTIGLSGQIGDELDHFFGAILG